MGVRLTSWYLDDMGTPILWPWPPRRFAKALSEPILSDFDLDVAPTST